MKKYLQRFICPLCIFVLIAPLFLHSDPVTAYDHATMQEAINTNVDRVADAKTLQQHTVLWDTTHGTYLNYYPFSRYSILTSMLIDSGYTIDSNPFTHHAVIAGTPANGIINIYDACGRLIDRITGPVFGDDLQEGVYFLELEGYAPQKVIKLE
jgi:hypothetical protein